ncbi:MAG: efflux RND transporter periplasmic adaptor subunit [bacterium]|nr:efflux RND transporter periplasmic adaptor subunit [bacterium]
MKKKIPAWVKKPIFYIPIAIVVIIGAIIIFSSGQKPSTTVTAKAEIKNLEQIVSVTGNVKPASFVNLAFERGGRVRNIYAEVSTEVFAGQVLVTLENADLAAQLDQANAGVKAQEAKLAQLKAGGSPENIAIAKVELQNAKDSLEDAKKTAFDTLGEALTTIDDAVRNKADGFFSNPESTSPHFNLTVDSNLKLKVEAERIAVQPVLNEKNGFPTSMSGFDFDFHFSKAKSNLSVVKVLLDDLAAAVNSLSANSSLSQTTIDSYKSTVSTARATIAGQISDVTTAEKSIRSAQATVTLEESQLMLAQNPARTEEIQTQEALVEEAKASAANALAQLSKTVLRSPISGVITKKNIEVGEIISANSAVMSVISSDRFEVEANVPEADIAKVAVGNEATVTLDAYGRDSVFKTQVVAVDPAETVIEGVSTYKITLQFIEEDERVRSGMTANIDVVTGRRENVLTVPQRAVIRSNGNRIVRVKIGEIIEERKVETGLSGYDGSIEILSGIKEGEEVVVFEQ